MVMLLLLLLTVFLLEVLPERPLDPWWKYVHHGGLALVAAVMLGMALFGRT
ncbi:MAG TPA: DUF3309 family protein [Holophaga sp.]|nr:DUF3309 family protein [Holophaga sp.]